MAGKVLDKNNLGFLGVDFQYKLIKSFIEEPGFFKESYANRCRVSERLF